MYDLHHRYVNATYGVASAYVLADTYDKGVKQSKVQICSTDCHYYHFLPFKVGNISAQIGVIYPSVFEAIFCLNQEPGADTSKVAIAAVDTLLWQALASVIVPGVY